MKQFLKNNFFVLFIYLVAICISIGFIFNYEKNAIHLYINQYVGNTFLNVFFYYITYLGDGLIAVFILIVIIIYNIRLGIYATSSFLTASLFSIFLKHQFFDDVNRPHFIFSFIDKHPLNVVEGVDLYIHNSFPSGHATQAFSIFMCLAFTTKNTAFKLLFLLIALVTCISRVYLSQHWLADITAGSMVGMAFSLLYYFVFIHYNKLQKLDKPLYLFKKI